MAGVTIIMPAYNAEKTLEESVRSVCNQTYPDWELLILDDGSKDGTLTLAKALAEADRRIRVCPNEENMGVSATRNRGVALATFPLIAFLDSDDMWLPEKLEKQLACLAQHPRAALCFTGSGFILEDGTASASILHVPTKVEKRELLKQNVISCSSVLARKEDLLANPMPDGTNMHEDFAVWLSLLSSYTYAVGVDEPLLTYRVSRSSKSGQKLKAAKMQWQTYRHCRIGFARSCVSFVCYAWRNVRKYASIYRQAR